MKNIYGDMILRKEEQDANGKGLTEMLESVEEENNQVIQLLAITCT